MRPKLTFLLWLCAACAQHSAVERTTQPMRGLAVADTDSLPTTERARIVEAIIGFRRMVFWNDSTPLEGCSVLLGIGADYRALMDASSRRMVSEPAAACGATSNLSSYPRRLVLLAIEGNDGEGIARVAYRAGSYMHEEEYKVRRISPRIGRPWVVTELRVWGARTAD
jgi:hypothetical protein